MKVALGTLKEDFSTSVQQDTSEFFSLLWGEIFNISRTFKENNVFCIFEIATCEECGTEIESVGSENSLHIHCAEDVESEVPLSVPDLIRRSFGEDKRGARCYSDNCNGLDTLHIVKKSLSNVPEILIIQINRFYRRGTKNFKNSVPIKIDCILDLQFALE